MKLIDLKNTEKGVITKVKGQRTFKKRMNEMGFIEGETIRVVRYAPLKDPVEYQLMNYEVAIRRSEADLIEVTREPTESNQDLFEENDYTEKIKREHLVSKTINIALVGNPNSGKTTLFNQLTKSVEHVGNYSGVTVDAKKSTIHYKGYTLNFMDLPGTYSLTTYSPEEKFVLEHLLTQIPDIVVNVVDAGNLERNLFLTTQLIDMNIPTVVALNMYDELEKNKAKLNFKMLGNMLGIPFVPTIGPKKIGINNLLLSIINTFETPPERTVVVKNFKPVERIISTVVPELDITKTDHKLTHIVSPRFVAVKLMEKDPLIINFARTFTNYFEIKNLIEDGVQRITSHFKNDIDTLLVNAKYGFIRGALKETYREGHAEKHKKTKTLDKIITHKYLGFPIFILFLWLMFQGTFLIGNYPMNWIDRGVQWINGLFMNHMLPGPLRDLITDGIIQGVGSVIIFLPNILLLFLFISIMEDTGYMARVAFIMDKLMHRIGLHGKSFIPLIMGFGCNVPAIMATRTIESKNDRLLTILINPFMSCSARLPVYILITSAFFPNNAGNVIFMLYFIGIAVAILIAILFKKIFFQKEEVPFVMELPPYRVPTAKSVVRHMWHKGVQYLQKMGNIILITSIIIWALGYFPRSKQTDFDKVARLSVQKISMLPISLKQKKNLKTAVVEKLNIQEKQLQESQMFNSYIGKIGRAVVPVFKPLGFDWKMTVSVITGITAKEVVVSTMGVLYPSKDNKLGTALLSEKDAVTHQPFWNKTRALAFLIFILLYFPCVATMAAVRKETGTWKWSVFMVFYTTGIAWLFSFAFFQISQLLF